MRQPPAQRQFVLAPSQDVIDHEIRVEDPHDRTPMHDASRQTAIPIVLTGQEAHAAIR